MEGGHSNKGNGADRSIGSAILDLLCGQTMLQGDFQGHVLLSRDRCGGRYTVYRRRTNVQQLTCKIDSSNSFYYLFFSFIILELKPLVLKGKVRGEKL